MLDTALKAALLALLFSYAVTPLVKILAFKIGAVDKPNERKVHEGIKPRLGGLAIFLAFIIASLIFAEKNTQLIGLIIGNLIIVGTGLLDDIRGITPKAKLFGQFVAALVLIEYGFQVRFITLPFEGGIVYLPRTEMLFTVLWIVGITNAVNLIDGLDGLAAGTSAIAATTIAVVSFLTGQYQTFLLGIILASSVLGFLKYNFNPAAIFMGDTGSMFLGFNLAAFAILGMTKSVTIISLVLPVIILGIPILDTLWAIMRRAKRKKPIFEADKKHLHHRLLHMGLSHRRTVLVIYGANIFLGISAVFIQSLGTVSSAVTFIFLVIIMLGFAWKLGTLTDSIDE